jgi:hypothetical protein
MAWQPGESGNPSGAPKRAKLWRDAINRAIKRREQEDPQALEKLAEKILLAVDAGDVSAMKELGDRIDGKPAQAITGGDDDDSPLRLEVIKRVIVDPTHDPDGEGV